MIILACAELGEHHSEQAVATRKGENPGEYTKDAREWGRGLVLHGRGLSKAEDIPSSE